MVQVLGIQPRSQPLPTSLGMRLLGTYQFCECFYAMCRSISLVPRLFSSFLAREERRKSLAMSLQEYVEEPGACLPPPPTKSLLLLELLKFVLRSIQAIAVCQKHFFFSSICACSTSPLKMVNKHVNKHVNKLINKHVKHALANLRYSHYVSTIQLESFAFSCFRVAFRQPYESC